MAELTQDELTAVKVFRALGDPTRFKIVRMLVYREEMGCGELQTLFGLSAPAMSHHTRVLQECRLLEVRKDGPYHFFRLRRDQLEQFAPALLEAGKPGAS